MGNPGKKMQLSYNKTSTGAVGLEKKGCIE